MEVINNWIHECIVNIRMDLDEWFNMIDSINRGEIVEFINGGFWLIKGCNKI